QPFCWDKNLHLRPKRSLSGKIRKIINPRGTFMWLFIGTFAVAFLAALMLVWLDDRIAETD
ncbi:TPA: light-harvesting protein, partial [Klebsiella variicola subsp. variicola]|nr:light-harvesting protein [Klebsiella variicola subsp. variicola]